MTMKGRTDEEENKKQRGSERGEMRKKERRIPSCPSVFHAAA